MVALTKQVKCSECETEYNEEECYINNKTGKIWCAGCLSLEKKKRLKNYVRPEDRI